MASPSRASTASSLSCRCSIGIEAECVGPSHTRKRGTRDLCRAPDRARDSPRSAVTRAIKGRLDIGGGVRDENTTFRLQANLYPTGLIFPSPRAVDVSDLNVHATDAPGQPPKGKLQSALDPRTQSLIGFNLLASHLNSHEQLPMNESS